MYICVFLQKDTHTVNMIVYSSIFINKYIAKACMELSVILIIEHCIKVIKKKIQWNMLLVLIK